MKHLLRTGGGYRVPDYPFIEGYDTSTEKGIIASSSTDATVTPIDKGSTYKAKFIRFFYQGKQGDYMLGSPDPTMGYWLSEMCTEESRQPLTFMIKHGYDEPKNDDPQDVWIEKNKNNAKLPYTFEASWGGNDPQYAYDLGTQDLFDVSSWTGFAYNNSRYLSFQHYPVPLITNDVLRIGVRSKALFSALGVEDMFFTPINEGDFEPFSIIEEGKTFAYNVRGFASGCLDLEIYQYS